MTNGQAHIVTAAELVNGLLCAGMFSHRIGKSRLWECHGCGNAIRPLDELYTGSHKEECVVRRAMEFVERTLRGTENAPTVDKNAHGPTST